jgi:multidrug transporter EmrE-like cation transporter
MMGYAFIALTILLTVYGQIVLKWQVGAAGPLPANTMDKVEFLARLLLNPWIISGFVAAFLASIAWMGAMTKFDISHAYPFMSLNFVLVIALSAFLFAEPVTPLKLAGLVLIISGIVVGSQG